MVKLFSNVNVYIELDTAQLVAEQVFREDRESDERLEEGLPVGAQSGQVQETRRGVQAVSTTRPGQHSPEHVAARRPQQDRARRAATQEARALARTPPPSRPSPSSTATATATTAASAPTPSSASRQSAATATTPHRHSLRHSQPKPKTAATTTTTNINSAVTRGGDHESGLPDAIADSAVVTQCGHIFVVVVVVVDCWRVECEHD